MDKQQNAAFSAELVEKLKLKRPLDGFNDFKQRFKVFPLNGIRLKRFCLRLKEAANLLNRSRLLTGNPLEQPGKYEGIGKRPVFQVLNGDFQHDQAFF